MTRWKHEGLLDAIQCQLEANPAAMRVQRQIIEHVFGTINIWIGATHFRTRRLGNVAFEMILHILAYDLKQVKAGLAPQKWGAFFLMEEGCDGRPEANLYP